MKKLLILAWVCLAATNFVLPAVNTEELVPYDQLPRELKAIKETLDNIISSKTPFVDQVKQAATPLEKLAQLNAVGARFYYDSFKAYFDRLIPDAIKQAKEFIADLKKIQQKNDPKEIKEAESVLNFYLEKVIPPLKGIKEAEPIEELLKNLQKMAEALPPITKSAK